MNGGVGIVQLYLSRGHCSTPFLREVRVAWGAGSYESVESNYASFQVDKFKICLLKSIAFVFSAHKFICQLKEVILTKVHLEIAHRVANSTAMPTCEVDQAGHYKNLLQNEFTAPS